MKSQRMACIDSRMLSTCVAILCSNLAWRPRVETISDTAHASCAEGLHFLRLSGDVYGLISPVLPTGILQLLQQPSAPLILIMTEIQHLHPYSTVLGSRKNKSWWVASYLTSRGERRSLDVCVEFHKKLSILQCDRLGLHKQKTLKQKWVPW